MATRGAKLKVYYARFKRNIYDTDRELRPETETVLADSRVSADTATHF